MGVEIVRWSLIAAIWVIIGAAAWGLLIRENENAVSWLLGVIVGATLAYLIMGAK